MGVKECEASRMVGKVLLETRPQPRGGGEMDDLQTALIMSGPAVSQKEPVATMVVVSNTTQPSLPCVSPP